MCLFLCELPSMIFSCLKNMFALSFASNSGALHPKCMKYSKQCHGENTEHRMVFLFPTMGTLVEDCKCSGHPSTCCTEENLEKIYIIINHDQQSTILETVGKTGLVYGTLQQILREGLNMW